MKYLSLLIILFSINSFSEDYKSATRLKDGDVISADVFNDIMDRIESSLKSLSETDLIGTWDLVQTVCRWGNTSCSGAAWTGIQSAVDNLYAQRIDTITFSNDGDGTYSAQQTNYCFLRYAPDANSPCGFNYATVDGRLILFQEASSNAVSLHIKKISETRLLISDSSGTTDFNLIRLDKKNLAPKPPTSLIASLSGGTVSLSWTASVGGATSYTIKAKTTATGTYSDVTTGNTSTTYSDSLSSGTKWYRIFAVNSDGTSIGSNVVSVTAP